MPDADGRFLGISVPAKAWERIFGGRFVEPKHGPFCTMIGDRCVGWHCPYCGEPSSSQGHERCRARAEKPGVETIPYRG